MVRRAGLGEEVDAGHHVGSTIVAIFAKTTP